MLAITVASSGRRLAAVKLRQYRMAPTAASANASTHLLGLDPGIAMVATTSNKTGPHLVSRPRKLWTFNGLRSVSRAKYQIPATSSLQQKNLAVAF